MLNLKKLAASMTGTILVVLAAFLPVVNRPTLGQPPVPKWNANHVCSPGSPSVCYSCETTGNMVRCEEQVGYPPVVIGYCFSENTTKKCFQDTHDCKRMFRCVPEQPLPTPCHIYYVCYDAN